MLTPGPPIKIASEGATPIPCFRKAFTKGTSVKIGKYINEAKIEASVVERRELSPR